MRKTTPKDAKESKKGLTLSEKRKRLAEKKSKKKVGTPQESSSPSQHQVDRLLEHYQTCRLEETETLATLMSQEFPNHQFAWKVLGAVLQQSGRTTESLIAKQRSVALAPQDAEAHYNISVTLQELGRLGEAESSLRQALSLQPDLIEAHNNLATILNDTGRLYEAETSYRKALIMEPHFADAHSNLGNTLKELGRLDEAEASCRRAIALKIDFADAHYNLGNTLYELGKLDEAEASCRQAIALKPDFFLARQRLLQCLFLQDKKSSFFEQLNYLISEGQTNAVTGSLACRAALKYGVEIVNPFCMHPLEYVSHIDLTSEYDFERVFVSQAMSLLTGNMLAERSQNLLISGKQTSGNLFELQNEALKEVEAIIRKEIDKYRLELKDSTEGFMTQWPSEYTLKGWLISMKSGGRLKPHIHNGGWLSGSIYINVPPKSAANSGNLNVSLGEDKDVTDIHLNTGETINVKTGSLVLFPSSLTHHTTPFQSEQERIVLAFDVKVK